MDYKDIGEFLRTVGGDEDNILHLRRRSHITLPTAEQMAATQEDVEEFLNRYMPGESSEPILEEDEEANVQPLAVSMPLSSEQEESEPTAETVVEKSRESEPTAETVVEKKHKHRKKKSIPLKYPKHKKVLVEVGSHAQDGSAEEFDAVSAMVKKYKEKKSVTKL